MNLQELTQAIEDKAAEHSPLNAKIKFDLGETGLIVLDATTSPPTLSHKDSEVDTTVIIAAENLEKILSGALDPTFAFMTGKLKINGSMGIAMKLNAVLGD